MKILAFAGSLRKASWNKKLLRHAADILRGMDHEVEEYDLSELPLMNEDLETGGPPPIVGKFRDAVAEADALVISTPEYNHSISTPTKNAVDWLSRPPSNVLAGKVAAVMGATVGVHGTVNAQRELRWILARLACMVLPWPWVLLRFAEKRFDDEGNLTDEKLAETVKTLMESLVDTAAKLK
jgi:chromate reductase